MHHACPIFPNSATFGCGMWVEEDAKRAYPAYLGFDPSLPAVYVGMTGIDPKKRFQNHKRKHKGSKYAHKYGVRLLPELYDAYNPMPYELAVKTEEALAERLRMQGYTVFGGH